MVLVLDPQKCRCGDTLKPDEKGSLVCPHCSALGVGRALERIAVDEIFDRVRALLYRRDPQFHSIWRGDPDADPEDAWIILERRGEDGRWRMMGITEGLWPLIRFQYEKIQIEHRLTDSWLLDRD